MIQLHSRLLTSEASATQMLQAEKKNLKSCPLCRQPLTQVMRYGRVLNKMKLDQADIQSAGQTHTQLGQAEAIYQQAAAATQSADQLGNKLLLCRLVAMHDLYHCTLACIPEQACAAACACAHATR